MREMKARTVQNLKGKERKSRDMFANMQKIYQQSYV